MPYGKSKTEEHAKQMYLKKLKEKVVEPAVTLTAEQICDDLIKTFEKCIDEFYKYETKSYYRHEVGRGTGTGWNLYLANQTEIIYNGDVVKYIVCGWDGTEMLPYFLSNGKGNKKPVNTEHVLDSVMNGVRFNGDGTSKYYKMKWEIENGIETQYFGTLDGKTPKKIFTQIMDEMFNVQKTLAKQNFWLLYPKYMV